MESCSFQSQMLSVMEVLAKAAVAEINRRVADSCAVLRLEVSQSRRDIDVLKGKCEVMEAELRRTRMRVRRKGSVRRVVLVLTQAVKLLNRRFSFSEPSYVIFSSSSVFYPPASPLIKLVLSRERQNASWDRQMDAEAVSQTQQVC